MKAMTAIKAKLYRVAIALTTLVMLAALAGAGKKWK